VDLSNISGLRFTFDHTSTGAIFLGNIRLAFYDDGVPLTLAGAVPNMTQTKEANNLPEGFHAVQGVTGKLAVHTGSVKSIRRVTPDHALNSRAAAIANDQVEIEISSPDGFPVMNSLPVLRVGSREFLLSRYPDNGATDTLIFTLTGAEFAQLVTGEEISLQYGEGNEPSRMWNLGSLSKNLLGR
jgi:hypothetical protein